MAYEKKLWQNKSKLTPDDLNKYEDTFEEHDQKLTQIMERQDISGVDLDSLKMKGLYVGNNLMNAPTNDYYYVDVDKVEVNETEFVYQRLTKVGKADAYILERRYDETSQDWSDWDTLATINNPNITSKLEKNIFTNNKVNTIVKAGEYYLGEGTNDDDLPVKTNGYLSVRESSSQNYVYQRFKPVTDNRVYERLKTAGTWQPWVGIDYGLFERGYLTTLVADGADFNTLINNGKFKVTDGTNKPDNSTSSTFLIEVTAMSSTYIFQKAMCLYSNAGNTGKVFYRFRLSNGWEAWRRIDDSFALLWTGSIAMSSTVQQLTLSKSMETARKIRFTVNNGGPVASIMIEPINAETTIRIGGNWYYSPVQMGTNIQYIGVNFPSATTCNITGSGTWVLSSITGVF